MDSRKSALPPAHLSDRAKDLWRAVAGGREMSPGRLALFQTALECLDRADQARKAIDRDGLTFTTESTGAVHLNPIARIEKDSRSAFAKIWKTLGFDWHYAIDGRTP